MEEGADDAGLPDQKSTRRIVGPAMPPQELLDAAAGVAEAVGSLACCLVHLTITIWNTPAQAPSC